MTDRIWVAIHPRETETRVLATTGPGATLLKARLSPAPWHQRALPTLLEALALWQRQQAHAVLAVDAEGSSCATSLCPDIAAEHARTPLYTLDVVAGPRRAPRRRDDITGMGAFSDLRQLMLFEVAR
jgi:hypothetical protein